MLGSDHHLLRSILRNVLVNYKETPDFYLAPDISANKLVNAKKACETPANESIVALINCALFGSAKDCLLFGNEGIYWHNSSSSKSPGRGWLAYGELAGRKFEKLKHSTDIDLGSGQYINKGSSRCSHDDFISMLEETASLFSVDASGLICPICGSHHIRIQLPSKTPLRSALQTYLLAGIMAGAAPALPILGLHNELSRHKRMKCCLDCGHHWPLS